MKRKLWTLLLALGAALALCVGAGAAEVGVSQANQLVGDGVDLNGEYKLTADIIIDRSIVIKKDKSVTLDLNGYVLKYENSTASGSVLMVEGGGALTINDSRKDDTTAVHKFDTTNDLWVLNDNPPDGKAETIQGGVITGGTGYPCPWNNFIYYGGGVCVAENGKLTMRGGNIVGCSAGNHGGGVVLIKNAAFIMSGGSIAGCTAAVGGGIACFDSGNRIEISGSALIRDCRATRSGGGVYACGAFQMLGQAVIRGCIAEGGSNIWGGGVYVNAGSSLEMSGQTEIEGCKAVSDSGKACGGGVYVNNAASLTMSGDAKISNCSAENSANQSVSYGGGVCSSIGDFHIKENARIENCKADIGSGLHFTNPGNGTVGGKITADGGQICGDVVIGDEKNPPCTVIGSGEGATVFEGKVILNPSCTIEKGKFNGEVINNGTITGGEFSGEVTNNKTISGGTFTGTVINGEGGTIAEGVSIPTLKFIVTFDNEDAKTTEIVAKGSKLTEPALTKEGYRFSGWYYDNNGSEATWNFDTDTVTRTMTLKAKWVQTHTVTFETNGGSAVNAVTVDHNDIVVKPADPTKSGYTFAGWYKESTYENPYDFNDAVTDNLTLYAKWTANPPAPSYDDGDPTYAVSAPTAENGKITVSPRYAERGERVTVTVTPDSGYELETISATDSRGNALKLTDLGGGKYTFTMPAGKVEVKATFMEDNSMLNFFYDVPNDAYYYEAVKWAVKNGITDGVGGSLFAPGQPCTRAQIVTFLWRAAGSPEPKGAAVGMTDVLSGSYYEKAVAWAIENGVTTGTTASTFSPDATCTRAQAVTFLARARNAKASGKAEFSDVPTGSYFAEAVAWAAANGVTEGVGSGLFGPDSNCTRGQIVTFLYRAYNR